MPARKLPAPAEAAVAARMLLDGLAEDQNVPAGMLLGPTDPPAAVDRGQPHARPRRLVGDLWWREVGIEPGWITLEGRQLLRFGVVGGEAAAAFQRGGAPVLLADQLEDVLVQRIGGRWHQSAHSRALGCCIRICCLVSATLPSTLATTLTTTRGRSLPIPFRVRNAIIERRQCVRCEA